MKNSLRKKISVYLLFLLILTIFIISYSLLVYYGKLSSETKNFNNVTYIIGVVSFFILGFLAGNVAQKNGLLEGLIAALIILVIVLISNFFISVPFVFKSIVKSLSYMISASLGGVIGVNFRSIIK